MIVMFPMLVSTTVSSDILPAISKALEKFILLYRMDQISARLSLPNRAMYMAGLTGMAKKGITGALLASKEYDGEGDLLAEAPFLKTDGPAAGPGGFKKGFEPKPIKIYPPNININMPSTGKSSHADRRPGSTDFEPDKRGVHFESPKHDNLALEPTYVELTHPSIGTMILGVKVLPFPVSSEFNLMYYLSHDMSSNWMVDQFKSRWRKYGRIAWTVLRSLWMPILGSPFRRTLTGDPQKDVAYASTIFKHNVFCLINYNDSVSQMVANPGTLRKMYKLGWNSLIFADDISRKATFCMNEFQGLCSTIPYSVMGASFGKEYKEVFQSMEDVKKSSASFFSVKKSSSSLFSEHFNLDGYLEDMQGGE